MNPRNKPCPTCPYLINCESGVWHESEYKKLIEYDRETGNQPVGVFVCHTEQDQFCRGWLDVHDKHNLLSLRLALIQGQCSADIFDLPQSGEPVFESGRQACEHGLNRLENPSDKAFDAMEKIKLIQQKKGM